MSIEEFAEALGSAAPTPGGGAAAALQAALGASLLMMVANHTIGKSRYAEFEELNAEVLEQAHELRAHFIQGIDRDAEAFSKVSEAYRLPRGLRETSDALYDASVEAAAAPLAVMNDCAAALELAERLLDHSNPNLRSDILVAALSLHAGLTAAACNVDANIPAIKRTSPEQAAAIRARSAELLARAESLLARITDN
jgi:formiminotetrahydrofolate cyclodeaminase